ncbi:MAG: DUF1648 domain-containing protein [Gemmatimonadetes bacterium]|nr:MAG: DUF1648 domain-containing protein [Gemmatimonadota bacterium]
MKVSEFIKKEVLIWLVMAVPFVVLGLVWEKLPEQVPLHWNFRGEVDRYGGKISLLKMALINIGVYVLMLVLPKIDPRRRNYNLFERPYHIIRLLIHLLLSALLIASVVIALGYPLHMPTVVQLIIVGVFLALGNYLGNIRPNYFVGIRTPWTLENEEVWKKTHRVAAMLWVFSSVMMLGLRVFVGHDLFSYLFIGYMVLIVLVPVIYSYAIYPKGETSA